MWVQKKCDVCVLRELWPLMCSYSFDFSCEVDRGGVVQHKAADVLGLQGAQLRAKQRGGT